MKTRTFFVLLTILVLIVSACGPSPATEAPTQPPAEEPTVPPAEEPAEEPEAEEPAEAAELRFTYYADGKEAEVM